MGRTLRYVCGYAHIFAVETGDGACAPAGIASAKTATVKSALVRPDMLPSLPRYSSGDDTSNRSPARENLHSTWWRHVYVRSFVAHGVTADPSVKRMAARTAELRAQTGEHAVGSEG